MRRFPTRRAYWNHDTRTGDAVRCRILKENDYRLMLGVVAAAERWWLNESLSRNPERVETLGEAVDKFNHPPRKKK